MKIKNCTYFINGKPCLIDVEGECEFGKDKIMLDIDDDITSGTKWGPKGYTVEPFLTNEEYEKLKQGLMDEFINKMRVNNIKLPANFSLKDYHFVVNDEEHLQMVESYRNFLSSHHLPVPLEKITTRISEITKKKLTNVSSEKGAFYSLRFVRPHRQDFNPPHKDVYLNRIRNAVNIFVPILGCTSDSSLPILPFSHFFKESEIEKTVGDGCIVNGIKYTVPCITDCKYPLNLIRPNPKLNEVLVFSPYLIHGGAINYNTSETRFSLEMRFWRV